MAPEAADGHGTFGFWVAVCFIVNYVMGSVCACHFITFWLLHVWVYGRGCFVAQGFLSIPSGFIAVGLVAGPAILFLFAFLCNTTCTMLLEAMARGHLYNMVSF